jgi:uncharacterized protein (DUF305 family)
MKPILNSKTKTLTVASFVLVSTTACGVSDIASDARNLLPSGIPTSISASTLESLTTYSPSEILFLQMMIPHHEQAVAISAMAEGQTQNPAILEIAKRIPGAQQPEIDQMKKLLTDAGLPALIDNEAGTVGLIPQSEVDKLSQVQDSAFDKLFLAAMILHHEGAIKMTSPVLDSSNPDIKLLAETINKIQTAEIAEMKALLEIP